MDQIKVQVGQMLQVLRDMDVDNRRRYFLAYFVPLVLILFLTTVFVICDNNSDSCGQNAWNEDFWGEFRGSPLCEKDGPGSLLSQQQDSTSNFAFMYFGMVSCAYAWIDYKNKDAQHDFIPGHVRAKPYLSFLYGASMCYLGFGSFLYHAYTTDLTFGYDLHGILSHIFLVVVFCSFLFVPMEGKYTREYQIVALTAWSLFSLIILILSRKRVIDAGQLFPISYVLIPLIVIQIVMNVLIRFILRERWISRYQFIFYLANLFSFIGAFFCQEDFITVKCVPESRFQFHALWHVLCAIGFFFIYLGLRFDKYPLEEKLRASSIDKINAISV